uniref:Uncharacterized protein n=1 Tax=Romanomermis culicivorax TaxID=13658 RepID=A0A915HRB6_ROMCU
MKTNFGHFSINVIVLPGASEDLLGIYLLAYPDLGVIIDFKGNAVTVLGREELINVVQINKKKVLGLLWQGHHIVTNNTKLPSPKVGTHWPFAIVMYPDAVQGVNSLL